MNDIDKLSKNIKSIDINKDNKLKEKNKGTNAGGSNTNLHGKKFEKKNCNENRLLNDGFQKKNINYENKKIVYLFKEYEDKQIFFVKQGEFARFMWYKYNISDIFRYPDEAYIIEYKEGKKIIKILEMKEQRVEGSVETKLWSGPSLKREYEMIIGDNFEIIYAYCISEFLKNKFNSDKKKYKILSSILEEAKIKILCGDDDDYFSHLDNWVKNF